MQSHMFAPRLYLLDVHFEEILKTRTIRKGDLGESATVVDPVVDSIGYRDPNTISYVIFASRTSTV